MKCIEHKAPAPLYTAPCPYRKNGTFPKNLPVRASYTPVFYAYTTAFSNNNYYYAAALAVVLAVITCIFSFSVLHVTQRQAGV